MAHMEVSGGGDEKISVPCPIVLVFPLVVMLIVGDDDMYSSTTKQLGVESTQRG